MIGAAVRKEVALLARDRGALISLFLLPIIFMVAFGSMLHFGPDAGRPQRVAYWHAAGDKRGDAIEQLLVSSPGLRALKMPSATAVTTAVVSGDATGGLVVHRDQPNIDVVLDPGLPLQLRGPLEAALIGLVSRAATSSVAWPPLVTVRSASSGNLLAQISSFQVAVPGNAVLFGFFIALTVAMAFTTERRTGTWRRLLAAPVARWKLLVAMLVPYFLIGLAQLGFLFAIGVFAFGMTVAGSVVALIAVSAAVSACAVCLGLMFAAFARTEKQLGGIGSVGLLVMGIIGGCMVPRLVMPPVMQTLGLAVPHGWALDAYYDVLVRGSTTLTDVLPAVGALCAFGAAFVALGLAVFRFE
jgi:ABC-2 type transport system permease protein